MDRYRVAPMAPQVLGDLRYLFGTPPEGWCWCVAWEVDTWEGWPDRSAEANRSLREALWAAGEFHGFVFYEDQQPIGWCRAGPTRAWPKLCRDRGLKPSDTEYVFSCFGLRPEHRKQGLLHVYLQRVLDALVEKGVKRVYAVPKNCGPLTADGEVWNGPIAIFVKAGFVVQRTTDRYQVLVCDLLGIRSSSQP